MNDEHPCLICWDTITNETRYVKCVVCNMALHANCFETYQSEKRYCLCPHCQQVGTLGVHIK